MVPLQSWQSRLQQAGYACSSGVQWQNLSLELVAHRSGFELAKFGNSETFFLVGRPQGTVRDFSAQCFSYAMQHRHVKLPCGFFESVTCFPVAVVDQLDRGVREDLESRCPPKHMAAFEFPVVYDLFSDELIMYQGTPLWGAVYYQGFRDQVGKLLKP